MLMNTGGGVFWSGFFRSASISASSPVILALPATSILATGGCDVMAMLYFSVNWPAWWSVSASDAATSNVTDVSSAGWSLRRVASTFFTRTSTSTIEQKSPFQARVHGLSSHLNLYEPRL